MFVVNNLKMTFNRRHIQIIKIEISQQALIRSFKLNHRESIFSPQSFVKNFNCPSWRLLLTAIQKIFLQIRINDKSFISLSFGTICLCYSYFCHTLRKRDVLLDNFLSRLCGSSLPCLRTCDTPLGPPQHQRKSYPLSSQIYKNGILIFL